MQTAGRLVYPSETETGRSHQPGLAANNALRARGGLRAVQCMPLPSACGAMQAPPATDIFSEPTRQRDNLVSVCDARISILNRGALHL